MTVTQAAAERGGLIRAAHLVTAADDEVVHDGLVQIQDGRIVRVGTARDFETELADPGLAVVDYGEATIVPGLIDAHCHVTLTGDGSTYEQQVLDPDEMLSLIAVSNMQRHLASGVTTIRDNGGRNRVVFVVREAIQRGYISGPRMLLAGRPITHSYGHFYWCNGVADSADEIRATVRQLVAEGADHIKIMASGGATAGNIPYYPSYTNEEMAVAVQAAHGLGRLTTAHCRAAQSMINAVDAGLDCIEHAEFLVPGKMINFGAGVASSGRMVYDRAITDRLHERGVFVSFTAQTGGYETLLTLRERAARVGVTEHERGRISALDAYFDMKLGILRGLMEDGMGPRLAISSDAGPYDVSFGGLQNGLQLAVEAGMTPLQAIRAATIVAAQACGVSSQLGSLAAGKVADLVVVADDATTDIARMREVRAVYRSGELVAPVVAYSGVDTGFIRLEPTRRVREQDC